jgi:hypothetical protein
MPPLSVVATGVVELTPSRVQNAMNLLAVVLCTGFVVISSWGCSNDPPPPMSDGPPSGQCNTLANDAPHVVPQVQPTAPPAPLGGTITDGRYVLTKYTLFIGPDGQAMLPEDFWAADVFVVAGTTIQSIEGNRMEGVDHLPGIARTYSIVATGTTLSVAQTCPTPTDATSIEFTANASEFRWYVPAAGATTEMTHTKQ